MIVSLCVHVESSFEHRVQSWMTIYYPTKALGQSIRKPLSNCSEMAKRLFKPLNLSCILETEGKFLLMKKDIVHFGHKGIEFDIIQTPLP